MGGNKNLAVTSHFVSILLNAFSDSILCIPFTLSKVKTGLIISSRIDCIIAPPVKTQILVMQVLKPVAISAHIDGHQYRAAYIENLTRNVIFIQHFSCFALHHLYKAHY